MARPLPRRERIEPVLDRSAESSESSDSEFDIRLDANDRTAGASKAAPKRSRRAAEDDDVEDAEFFDVDEDEPRPRSRRATRKSSARRKARRRRGGGDGGGFSLFRAFRRTLKWGIILGVWGIVALVGAVGYYATKLPSDADWSVLPKRPPNIKILANDGTLIANRGDTGGEFVKLDELPAYLPQAVIAIEDRRFYSHFGIDPIGLARAAVTNLRSGGVVQGGSTLTQQLAKNLFLKPERTFDRKLQEAIMAVWLEAKYTKAQILEAYLNRVYLGAGAYGVDAASRRYFGKSARDISLKEAAILAGLLKAPSRYAPTSNQKAADDRADVVLGAMHDAGFITAADEKKAAAVVITPREEGDGGSARYVADWVADLVPDVVGALDQDVIVETTIDAHLQDAAGRAVTETLDKSGKTYGVSQGALVAIDGTGAVRALVGGRDYQKSQFNRAVEAKRQPGSAFKPFVYLTALEFGLTPETVRIDEPTRIGKWEPKNYEKTYKGPITLQTALALSINTVAVQLANEVGPASVVKTAERLGIHSPLQPNPSIALGTSEVSLLELTDAYVPFANDGYAVPPHVISAVKSVDGKTLYQRPETKPTQVIDPTYIGMMNSMLQDTLSRGTGRKAAIDGWPAAGKTGTTNDSRDAWFIGYTANLTAGVWLGNDDFKPTKRMTGGSLPAQIWHRFMVEAHKGVPVANLPGDYTFRDPNAFQADAAPQQTIGQGQPAPAGWQDPSGSGYPQQDNTPTGSTQPAVGSDGNYAAAPDPEASDGTPGPNDQGYYGNGQRVIQQEPLWGNDPYTVQNGGPVPPADVGQDGSYQTHPRQGGGFLRRLFGG
ncbi:penicillin-binding protein 1A [Kaistia dalseonensis]|uniref:peptidoglycan glycosyltransferase n=1 Tax=Kaistia dalseonensis TaxID=410840 RepID=A0ABU0H5V4_9HYPH|nr:penicillin-binding protein 1A [Kaistia dalseonensis]MCX5495106.1 penicillin-binding protein 1A [Kaistia dalseonensis]MDQ0437688.1 penicillin-binding protein 1A [Kaistia dalseonensis]